MSINIEILTVFNCKFFTRNENFSAQKWLW